MYEVKKAPFEGIQPTIPADGLGTVVEQTILNFIKEMQEQDILTLYPYLKRANVQQV